MDASDWDARYAGTELIWTAKPNRFLVAEIDDLAPGRALDLACGEGRNAVWLATKGWQATGIDFSRVGLDKGGALAAQGGVDVEFVQADVTKYEPPARDFDLVVMLYLQLPHDEFRSALDRAASALAPGGTLLVVGHDLTNLTDGYGGPQHPSVLFTPDDVVRALPALNVLKAERVDRHVETDDGPRVAIDALVRLQSD
ncbi:MAG: hypothetical protein QOC92_2030 [Acidimicrobiaceae bacterium]|jgi:SAM-dependent methyltransferase